MAWVCLLRVFAKCCINTRYLPRVVNYSKCRVPQSERSTIIVHNIAKGTLETDNLRHGPCGQYLHAEAAKIATHDKSKNEAP